MAARPGRPQRIAVDETPLDAPVPDLRARVGWLLAMSRLHHEDATLAEGQHFVERLAAAGVTTSRSVVSRWEAGQLPVPRAAFGGYERALGLASGQLGSVVSYLRCSLWDRDIAPVRLDPRDDGFAARCDRLVERAEGGSASSAEWQELGWHLTSVPWGYLPTTTRDRLVAELVDSLPRGIGVAYRRLSVAAFSLSTVPQLQDPLVGAIGDYLADPAVQVVNNPLVLLERLPTRDAARLVLDVLEHSRDVRTYHVGAWLARQKLVRGELDPTELDRLHMLVLRAWRTDPEHAGRHLAELIVDLPAGLRDALVSAARKAGRGMLGYSVEHREDLAGEQARALSEALALRARAGAPGEASYDGEVMLVRLLREALFSLDTERSHWAGLLLDASPFSRAVGDTLLTMLTEPGHSGELRRRLATLLRYVCDETHRLRLLDLVDDSDDLVAAGLLQCMGHLRHGVVSDRHLRGALSPDWSVRERARFYALGMTGSPALASLARSRTATEQQRAAAEWWLRAGPAITD